MAIENYDEFCDSVNSQIWNTEPVFKPNHEWDEDDGLALFFKLGSREPPEVTSPISSNWDKSYFTHWMALPKELVEEDCYRIACIKSGIQEEFR